MNTNAARNTQVLRMIEKALAPESFVSDPFLISRFAKKNALPISDLLAQRDFIANLVDADEIVDTLKNSQKYVALQDSDVDEFLIYFYNFAIYPNMLVLKQISQEEYRSEIQFYIEKICGNNQFMIYNSTNNTDLYVYFNAFEDCIAFWRGTKYFPFLGRIFIKTEIYSQWSAPLQAENNHNMNYNFHQNRNGQNRRNYQNNHSYNNNHHNSSHNVNYYNSHNANHNGVTNINHGNNNSNNSNHNNNSNSGNISNSSNNGNNNGYHNSSYHNNGYHNNGNSNDCHSSGGSQQRGGRSQQRGPIQIRTGQQQQPARAGMQPQQPHRSNSQRSVSQQRSYQSQKGGGSRQSRNNNQISMQQQPQPQMPSQTHSNQNSPQNGSTTNYSNNSNFSNSPYMTQNNNQYAGQADQNSSKQNQVHVQPPGRPQTPQQTFNHNRQKNSQIFQWQPQTQSPNSQQNQQQSQGQQQQQNNQQQLQSQENNDETDDHIMRSAPTSPKVQKRRQYHQFPKKK